MMSSRSLSVYFVQPAISARVRPHPQHCLARPPMMQTLMHGDLIALMWSSLTAPVLCVLLVHRGAAR